MYYRIRMLKMFPVNYTLFLWMSYYPVEATGKLPSSIGASRMTFYKTRGAP